jgi:hypothetical protein
MRLVRSLLLCVLFFSCNDKKNNPDVSEIKINISTIQFEQAFFKIDTLNTMAEMNTLATKYPGFTQNYLLNILNVDPKWPDSIASNYINGFIGAYKPIYDTSQTIFKNFSKYENEIKTSLQYLKYYFPKYKTPQKIITYLGPLDGYGDLIMVDAFAIGLHQHLGKNASYYNTSIVSETYPPYISARFEPSYISINCMKNVVLDLYPEAFEEKSLVIQMIEKGKRLYMLEMLLPEKSEYQLIGFTQKQMEDCNDNEASIWNLFIQNNLLQSTDYNMIRNYIGESPKTQELGDASPGNIGSFVGWQIVRKYMSKNSGIKLNELMTKDAEEILSEAKYKP